MKTCPLSGSKIRFSCPKFNHIPFLRQLPIAHRTACKLRSSPVFMVRDPLVGLSCCVNFLSLALVREWWAQPLLTYITLGKLFHRSEPHIPLLSPSFPVVKIRLSYYSCGESAECKGKKSEILGSWFAKWTLETQSCLEQENFLEQWKPKRLKDSCFTSATAESGRRYDNNQRQFSKRMEVGKKLYQREHYS